MSANNAVIMAAFFNHASELLKKLQVLFPEERDLGLYKQSLWLIGSTAATGLPFMKRFYAYTSPFKKQLMVRDEAFFMDLDYGENVGGSQKTMMQSLRIKELSKSMGPASKKALFEYFEGLLLLCEKLD